MAAMFATLLAPSLAAASGVHALFDLDGRTTATAPFPSDRFTVPDTTQNTGLRVDLPKPSNCSVQVSDCEDIDTLNTLDGFNLQPRLSIPFSGPIDVRTVSSDTVFLVSPEGRRIGINEVVWDVESNTLHVESDELLEQHTKYVLIVTRGIRDSANEPLEASGAFQAFRHGKKIGHVEEDPAVTGYRHALIAGLERVGAAGEDLDHIAVASVFTTQSITAILEKIRDQIKAATPEPAELSLGPAGIRTVAPVGALAGITFRRQLRTDPSFVSATELARQLASVKQNPDFPGAVGHVAFGKYRSPSYLTPCLNPTREAPCDRSMPPVGTRTGTPLIQGMEEIFFNLFLPAETPLGHTPERRRPAAGWPVVILGMGSSDNKELGSYLVAPAMAAQGVALIAINGLGQGFGPLSTLTLRADLNGDGIVDSATFSSGPRSFDQNGDGLIGTGTLPPANEGNEVLPQGSSISRRDILRQTVVDLMQLVRVIEVGIDVDGDGSADLDPSRIYFVGFSQGASIGTMFAAIEPRVRAVVLNVVGGANIEAFRLSPVNRPGVGSYLERRVPPLLNAPGIATIDEVSIGTPRFHENLPLRNSVSVAVTLADGTGDAIQSPVTNAMPGAMDIQRVIEHTQWALQARDPSAYAPYLRKHSLDGVPKKSVLVQFARGDQTIPNPATTVVVRAGDLAGYTTLFRNDLALPNTTLTRDPHGFALRLPPPTPDQRAVELQAQRQIGRFVASDGTEIIDPDGPCAPEVSGCLFEVPVEGALPEDLGFIP